MDSRPLKNLVGCAVVIIIASGCNRGSSSPATPTAPTAPDPDFVASNSEVWEGSESRSEPMSPDDHCLAEFVNGPDDFFTLNLGETWTRELTLSFDGDRVTIEGPECNFEGDLKSGRIDAVADNCPLPLYVGSSVPEFCASAGIVLDLEQTRLEGEFNRSRTEFVGTVTQKWKSIAIDGSGSETVIGRTVLELSKTDA